MILRMSPAKVSLLFTASSVLLAVISIQLGRRLNYLEHLPMFNVFAATMLGLVGVGLVAAIVPLFRARWRSPSLWLTAALAALVLSSYLLDE